MLVRLGEAELALAMLWCGVKHGWGHWGSAPDVVCKAAMQPSSLLIKSITRANMGW
jgi:hypothetical protein